MTPSVSDFAGSPMNREYGKTSVNASAAAAASAVVRKARAALCSTHTSRQTTSGGARKNR